QIGIGNCVVETCNAFTYSPHSPPQQAFCGEQSHLGIVGYLAFATIGRGVVGYAVRAKAAQNFSAGYELNGGTEGIAYGAAEEAGDVVVTHARITVDKR